MKKILITGATDGIGLATAKRLAEMGYELLLHGRNKQKLATVVEQLKTAYQGARISAYCADMANIKQVCALIAEIQREHQTLDILINNAGVYKTSNANTQYGIDARFVVNTLSPIILIQQLLPQLANDGRIINLSSAAQASINLAALRGKENIYDDFQAYAQSKLAITIFSQVFADSLKQQQVMVAVNPGSLLASKMVKEGFGVAGNDLNIGVDILIKAALSESFATASGKYFDNDIQQFSVAHQDAQHDKTCQEVMSVLKDLCQQLTS